MQKKVKMGVIGAAQGLKGAVHLKSFTENPLDIGEYGALQDEAGRFYEISHLQAHKNGLLAQFKHVNDRDAAEKLRNVALYVLREQLPSPKDEEEYYYADLEGLRVQDTSGQDIGKIVTLCDFGAGPLLEVDLVAYGKVFVPFTKWAVCDVCLSAGYVVLCLEKCGLLEEEAEDKDFSPSRNEAGEAE